MKTWQYQNQQWTHLPNHLRHLPLITREFSLFDRFLRFIWSQFLKRVFFFFYIRLEVKGDFESLYEKYPKLIVISNHGSHLDAISIAAAIPFKYWVPLYAAAAKDYFFSNPWISFFSQKCIGAIPIDRKGKNGEAIKLVILLLTKLSRIWIILFPEGTRSPDGKIQTFKRGVSVFAQKSNTPILFLYLQGAYQLWPKGAGFASPGKLCVHVGPVQEPADIETINKAYREWVESIEPGVFKD